VCDKRLIANRVSLGKVSVDVVSAVLHIEHTVTRITLREARFLAALMCCPERPLHRQALMRTMGITKTAKPSIIESYV
jgi:DNA-binding response OmpR family regulator